MALLYPGLKVRKVRPPDCPNLGKTGTVVSTEPQNIAAKVFGLTLTVRWNVPVLVQRHGEAKMCPAGTEAVDNPDNFEPIVPDGLLTVEQLREELEEEEACA